VQEVERGCRARLDRRYEVSEAAGAVREGAGPILLLPQARRLLEVPPSPGHRRQGGAPLAREQQVEVDDEEVRGDGAHAREPLTGLGIRIR
jgi:hypothetical protein